MLRRERERGEMDRFSTLLAVRRVGRPEVCRSPGILGRPTVCVSGGDDKGGLSRG